MKREGGDLVVSVEVAVGGKRGEEKMVVHRSRGPKSTGGVVGVGEGEMRRLRERRGGVSPEVMEGVVRRREATEMRQRVVGVYDRGSVGGHWLDERKERVVGGGGQEGKNENGKLGLGFWEGVD
ncbi:hypothetical protein HAX54_042408 [Datura stramonium]|uniref:Uncharacterized protein n=1 Tax=Datura stramonium TaxID=4076 RepID=A0ABS8VZN3_DATST|nr:hypothetical protein [Datura stramonium]